MHGTKVPLRKWFGAIYLTSQDKRGVSAMSLQKELSVSYPATWLMPYKIHNKEGKGEEILPSVCLGAPSW
jgi:hypothetical protein